MGKNLTTKFHKNNVIYYMLQTQYEFGVLISISMSIGIILIYIFLLKKRITLLKGLRFILTSFFFTLIYQLLLALEILFPLKSISLIKDALLFLISILFLKGIIFFTKEEKLKN